MYIYIYIYIYMFPPKAAATTPKGQARGREVAHFDAHNKCWRFALPAGLGLCLRAPRRASKEGGAGTQ